MKIASPIQLTITSRIRAEITKAKIFIIFFKEGFIPCNKKTRPTQFCVSGNWSNLVIQLRIQFASGVK
jgi:hypothetical protein